MATPVLIPVSEYLNTTYRPDRDYVDGELKEINLGEKPHALLQGICIAFSRTIGVNGACCQFLNNASRLVQPIFEYQIYASSDRFQVN